MIGMQLLTPAEPVSAAITEMPVIGKDGAVAGSVSADGIWGDFDIVVTFLTPVDPAVAAAFSAAEAFWESRILGYRVPEAEGVAGLRSLDIFADVAPIDGAGGILGTAGAFGTARAGGFLLPTSGTMNFDEADVARQLPGGGFEAIVRHEMAHVMGFSDVFWADAGAVSGTGQDTSYTGAFALAAYRAEFDPGADFVPVEGLINGQVRPGTSFAHWDEELFADHLAREGNARNPELMTGILHTTGLYVSDTTVASFADLGYAVDLDLAPDPEDDFGESTSTAGAAVIDGAVTGRIETPGDRDWFAVTVESGRAYVFTLEGEAGGGGTLADPVLRLLNDNGAIIAESDDTETLDARLSYRAEADGVLFLSAGAFADAGTGTYRLGAALQPPLEVNLAPVAAADSATVAHGGARLVEVLANDTDADGGALTLDAVTAPPAHGTAEILGDRLLYAADPGFSGADSLTYRVSDGAGGSDIASVAITVLAPAAPADGVVRGTSRADLLAPAQGATYLGGAGPDTFLLSRAMVPLATSIVEGDGADELELIAGLEVVQSRFQPEAVELTFDSGATVRVLNADAFVFDIGGNSTTGVEGTRLGFDAFAALFGVAVPASGEVAGTGLVVPEPGEGAALAEEQAPDGLDFL